MYKNTALYISLFFLLILSACTSEDTSQTAINHDNNPEIEAVQDLLIDNLNVSDK